MDIEFSDKNEFYFKHLTSNEEIPCHCKIGKQFQLDFTTTFNYEIKGYVKEWNEQEINRISPAYSGDEFYQNCPAIITIEQKSGKYKVKALSFFNYRLGWLPIIQNYEYANK